MNNKLAFKFSILIPNLGFNDYLFECLDSAIAQQNKLLYDLEIIFCDQSEDILYKEIKNNILKRYKTNINVFHSDVKSLYYARISLLNKASGDYIVFLDSDDKLLPNSLTHLYKIINKTNKLDLYQYKLTRDFTYFDTNKIITYDKNKYIEYFLSKRGTYPSVLKCFKKKNIEFYKENIFLGEDGLFSFSLIQHFSTFAVIDSTLYYYRKNTVSGSHKMKAHYLDDLCKFLNITIPFRKSNATISELIYNFCITTVNIYSKTYSNKLLKYDNVTLTFNHINKFKFKSNCLFFMPAYKSAIQNNKLGFKINYLIFRIFSKILSLINKPIIIILKGENNERS